MNQQTILMFLAIVFHCSNSHFGQDQDNLRASEISTVDVKDDKVERLILKLQSSNYQARVEASQKLVSLGSVTIEPLFNAILSSDFETSFRSTKIVKEIGLNSDLDTLESIIRKSQELPLDKRQHFDEWSLKAISGWKERKSKLAENDLVNNGATVVEIDQFAELGLMLVDDLSDEIRKVKENKGASVDSVLEQIKTLKKEMAGELVVDKKVDEPSPTESRFQRIDLGGRFVVPARGKIVSPVVNPKSNPRQVKFDSEWKGEPEDLLQLRFVENLSQIEFIEMEVTPEILMKLGKIRKLRSLLLTRCSFSFAALKEFKKQKDAQYPLQLMATGRGYLGVYGPNAGEPNEGTGSYVSLVSPNSAASAAGIERGDLITKVDDDPIQSFAELSLVISSKPVGKEIKISVQRADEEKVLTAKLKSRAGLR